MSILDVLNDLPSESAGQEPPPGLAALLGALGGEAPTATTPASTTGLPPSSPVDNSMVIPLMLMRAAAEVSARRAPGQSRTNQNITALYNAGLAGMALKGENEDRAQKARKLQLEEAVTQQNLSTAQQAQQQNAELHPLKVMAARLGITEEEAKAKVAQTQAKYAEAMAQAKLEYEKANTDEKRAAASKKMADIEHGQRRLDLLMTGQQIQGQRLQLQADQLEIQRRKAEEANIKPFGMNPETGKPAGITWTAGGDQMIRTFGEDEITATKTVIKLNETRKQLAASLNQPYVPPTPEQIQREIKLRMMDRTERRTANGELVPVTGNVQPGQAAPAAAPAPKAGGPGYEDTVDLTSAEIEQIRANAQKAPPGMGYKDDKGRVWRSDPGNKYGIRLVPQGGPAGAAPAGDSLKSISDAEFQTMLADAKRGGDRGKAWLKEHESELTLGQRKQATGLY